VAAVRYLETCRSGDGNMEAIRMGVRNGSKGSKGLVYYKSNYVPNTLEWFMFS
jgi:hypothetical protein